MFDRNTLILKNRFLRQRFKNGLKSNLNKKKKTPRSSLNFAPNMELQLAFRSVIKKLELKDYEYDEVRKSYFLYFKFYKELISGGSVVPVDFFKLGKILPSENLIRSSMNSLSKKRTKTNRPEKEVISEFFKLLKILFNIHNSKIENLEKKGFEHEGFKDSIYADYQGWVANFKARGVYIKSYEDWEGNGSGQGFFI